MSDSLKLLAHSLATAALHNLHSASHAHSAATSTSLAGRRSRSVEASSSGGLLLLGLGVADGLVNREDGAGGLSGGGEHVDSHDLGFPDKLLVKVGDFTVQNVNTNPDVLIPLDVVLHAELVKNVSGVHSGVFSELLGDGLEGLGVAVHNELGLALDGADVLAQVAGKLHLDGATSGNNRVGADGTGDNHDGVVEGASGFLNVLGSATTEHDGDGLGVGALGEHVVAFGSDLNFLEFTAVTENGVGDSEGGGLHLGTGGLTNTVEVLKRDAASAEDIAVSEVLSSEITDGELRENDLGASFDNGVELIVDDLPFSVDDLLEVVGVLKTDLSGVLLSFQLEFEVKDENLGVVEFLGLLLETGVGESLAEADALDEERVSDGATSDLLDTDIFLVEIVGEVHDGIDNHVAEEVLVAGDNLGVKGSHSALLKQVTLLSFVLISNLNGNLPDAGKAKVHSVTVALDNNGGVHAFLNELLGLLQEFASGEDDRGGAISDFVVLGASDIDESLGGGVHDVEETDKGGAIVGDSHTATVVDELVHAAGTYRTFEINVWQ